MNRKKTIVTCVSAVLVILLIAAVFLIPREEELPEAAELDTLFSKLTYQSSENGYDDYLERYAALPSISQKQTISAEKEISEGEEYNFNFATAAGRFTIEITYRLKDVVTAPEYSLKLNGEQPYTEAGALKLSRRLTGADAETDERGNQYSVKLSETDENICTAVSDPTGYHISPLVFAAEDGENTLSLKLESGKAYIVSVTLLPFEKKDEQSSGENSDGMSTVTVEAEFPLYRSDASITEVCDRSTPTTSPAFEGLQVWNALGGNGWSSVGQYVTWEVDVPASGYYSLALRYRQNYASGRTCCRRLLIDGEAAPQGLEFLEFGYDGDWQLLVPSDEDGKNISVWLSEGRHILTLEVSLGESAQAVSLAKQLLYEINTVYRKIVMQTGANPDKYRDYQIEKKMPEIIEAMKNEVEILNGLYAELYGENGTGEDSASITKLIWQIEQFIAYPESIPSEMATFQSNITAFGTWLQDKMSQPLCLDYIQLIPAGSKAVEPKAGFFKRLTFGCMQFIRSFSEEYGTVGAIYDDDEALTVWLTLGRDQYQIIKSHTDNDFTAEYGIPVSLKLVSGGLLESISAGIAPDVYLFGSEADPVNFASRGALINLTEFDDFDEVKKRFSAQALLPFEYSDGVYALPLTQSFMMLFARDDILAETGLSVPKTWDDVYNMLTVLQQNHMEFGFPVPTNANISSFALMLFQKQDFLYKDDGKCVAIDTEESLEAFEEWTILYTDYESLVSYNFVNRFRTGDMPIGIADLSTYNTLQVSAPEINGMWSMYPIPSNGSNECGNSVSSVTSAFILNSTESPENSWQFLKWFTGKEEQLAYANAIENLQGSSARFNTANIEAFGALPWKSTTLSQIEKQRETALGIEQVPGGYFLSRHVDNIYRTVKNEGADVRQTVLEYTEVINAELTRKRREFGLEVAE